MMNNNVKTAMVGTPCQILAATKINEYSDETGGSSIDVKIGLFCMENFSYTYLKEFLIDKKLISTMLKVLGLKKISLK